MRRKTAIVISIIGVAVLLLGTLPAQSPRREERAGTGGVKKLKDFVIYQDRKFYCMNPSLVVKQNGEIICAFRRAPDRRFLWGAPYGIAPPATYTHTDANAYLVLIRSRDGGATWSEPELMYAHPFGGTQEPSLILLRDGAIVCHSYAWALLPPEGIAKLKEQGRRQHLPFAFLGGYILRSNDDGKTWLGPFTPPAIPGTRTYTALGEPTPAHNRGAMVESRDGRLYWAVARADGPEGRFRTWSVHLLTSSDRGQSWQYCCPIATDLGVSFNETSLIETVRGDIIAFLRTENFGGRAAYARMTNGKTFEKWQDGGFIGHPFHAVRLRDGRILLVYGYRLPPFGIRAKLLNPDGTDVATAPEIVLREDGGSHDLGYPWALLLPDGKVMVAYYFNSDADGPRSIAATLLSIE